MSIKRLENEIAKLTARNAEKDAIIQDLTNKLAEAKKSVAGDSVKSSRKPATTAFTGFKEEEA